MSNILSTLKVKFSADTSEFKKGTEDSKKAMNDFTSQSSGYMGELAESIGLNVAGMSSTFGAFKKTLASLSVGFKGAAAGSGTLAGALNILKVALISTGIGAIVVLLGSLVAYFTSTGDGADRLSKMMASLGAAFRVVMDQAANLGRVIVEAFDNPKEAVTALWEFIKSQFVNRFTAIPALIQSAFNIVKGIFTGGAKDAAKDFAQAFVQLNTGFDAVQQNKIGNYFKNTAAAIGDAATKAGELDERLDNLEDAQRALGVTESERIKRMKALRLISSDETKSIEERLAASKRAMELELANDADRVRLAKELVAIRQGQVDLRGKNVMDDDLDALAEAQRTLNDLQSESLTIQKKLQAEYNNLGGALLKLKKETDKFNGSMSKVDPLAMINEKLAAGFPNTAKIFEENTKKIEKANYESYVKMMDSAYMVLEIGPQITQALTSAATGMGQLIGAMMSGTSSISDLGSFALGTLADLMSTVGQIAIETGMAVLAIQTSLKTLNPYVAIAAGVALIALSSAVKGNLQKAASGGGSSSGISGSAASSNTFDARSPSKTSQADSAQLNVNVTGEFKQRGADLVAVVTKENKRKALTT